MQAALLRPPELPVTGAPLTYHKMELAVHKGSPATSLNELPQPLVLAPRVDILRHLGVQDAQPPALGDPAPLPH